MRRAILVWTCVLAWSPLAAFAQDDRRAEIEARARTLSEMQQKIKEAQQKETPPPAKPVQTKIEEAAPGPKFVRTLTNVQVELTLSDHVGTQAPEKKTVSMIVSSGSWGKVRSVGFVGMPPVGVELNVDARPFVAMEGGQIQLEMTLVYAPPGADKDTLKSRPTGVNQSLTVILQSGKPLVVSQAADPISDRKVIVEVKATVLK